MLYQIMLLFSLTVSVIYAVLRFYGKADLQRRRAYGRAAVLMLGWAFVSLGHMFVHRH